MSLQRAPWWASFVSRLRNRPLVALAEELGEASETLLDALRAADPGGPAEDAPWWPELLRLRASMPLRALARRFGAEPRRIRRALARAGLRAGGLELAGQGVPALAGFVERLGKAPDADIAREAGVAVEAVQGERRRLGIAPFTPAPLPSRVTPLPQGEPLTREEEAWIRGPEPVKRRWARPDEASLEVVRRPTRAGDRRAPEPRPWGGPERRVGPSDRRSDEEPVSVERRGPEVRPTSETRPEGERRLGRDFFRRHDDDEMNRLLQGAGRPRDGRQRIVRADVPRGAALPTTLGGGREAAARGTEGVVRRDVGGAAGAPMVAEARSGAVSATVAGAAAAAPGVVEARSGAGSAKGGGGAVPAGVAEARAGAGSAKAVGAPAGVPAAAPSAPGAVAAPAVPLASGIAAPVVEARVPARSAKVAQAEATEGSAARPASTVAETGAPARSTKVAGGVATSASGGPARMVAEAGAPGRSAKVAAEVGAPNGAQVGAPNVAHAGAPNAAQVGAPNGAHAGAPNGAQVGALNAAPAAAPVAGARTAPVGTPTAPANARVTPRTWLVRRPGDDAPLVVDAPDVLTAARVAAARLPPNLWNVVAIELAVAGGAPRREAGGLVLEDLAGFGSG